jgi:hypothetical protein
MGVRMFPEFATNSSIDITVNYFLSDSLIDKSLLKVNVIKNNEYSTYTYTNIDSDTTIYSVLTVCDTVFYYNNIECKLLETKRYVVDGKEYDVITYLFDIKHSDDEELLLFFHPSYGLLVEYSEHWNLCKTFESDYITKHLALSVKREQGGILSKPTYF